MKDAVVVVFNSDIGISCGVNVVRFVACVWVGFVELVNVLVDGCHGICKSGEQFVIGSGRESEVDQSFMVFGGGLGFGGGCVIGIVAMKACLFCGVELVMKKTLGIVDCGFGLVLKLAQVSSVAAQLFHSLHSLKYNPVLKTRV